MELTRNAKVSIIGAGNVGASIAYALMLKDVTGEIILIDVNKNQAQAEVLDIRHGVAQIPYTKITAGDFCDIKDSDLIIITAGRNRRPNETRLDMAKDNIQIAKSVADEIKKYYTKGIVLVVSNPVDVITYKMIDWLNLPRAKVFGSGCILDSSRFSAVLADYLGITPESVDAYVIGEHGESQVPLWSKVKVNGLSLEEYCKASGIEFGDEQRNSLSQKVLSMGTEIIKGKGKTNYGIATCVCAIANSILNNQKIVASVCVSFSGEYNIEDVAMSLPCVISSSGVEEILSERLSDDEYAKLQKSALAIKNIIQA